VKFWRRKGKAVKNWRSRAWSIDFSKTNLTIIVKKSGSSQHVPPWIREKFFAEQI
jgi:hypothetical protein